MTFARNALLSALALALIVCVWGAPARGQNTIQLRAEKVREAIAEVSARVAEAPDDIELLIELGNLYYENDMYDQARETYLEVVEMDSTHVGGRLNLGSVYVDLEDIHNAEIQFRKAMQLDPDDPMVYVNLGTAYYTTQRFPEAIEMFRKALELDADNVETHFNLGVAFADAYLFQEAISEWEKVVELDPEGPIADLCRENVEMLKEYRSEN